MLKYISILAYLRKKGSNILYNTQTVSLDKNHSEYGVVKIKIDIPEDLIGLAGNPYGREIFDTFVEPKMNKGKIIIEFPEHLEMVAAGFVQGFIYKIGAEKFKEQFEVQGSPEFVKGFIERLD